MRKKWIYSVSVVLVLSLVVDVQAVATHWSGAGPDSLFSTPENWNPQAVPTAADDMFVDQPDGTYCVVPAGVDGECGTLRVGNSGFATNLDIAGGLWRGEENKPYIGKIKRPIDIRKITRIAFINKGKVVSRDLYDYVEDPKETVNLADDKKYSKLIKELAKSMRESPEAAGCPKLLE